MTKKEKIQQLICEQRLLPLYYHDSTEVSADVLKTLYNAGIKAVEYTNRGPKAFGNFRCLRKLVDNDMPGMQLGIGTIKSITDAEQFISAGADFIVCPMVNIEVAQLVHNTELFWIPGCMTPTEIYIAETNGATLVKIFPGSVLGPSYISALKEVFPHLLFMPTGGVELDKENLQAWFSAGVCAVGMGSKLISKIYLNNKEYIKIESLTKNVLRTLQSF
jgi:2-dehydro-3-deoxyphosphogluconate aldolase/(4S)-4-hydroxy-2-oxoglutarate aldolase